MKNENSLDIYMVASEKDLRLLRHFLMSYELFFHSKGKIYLWIWKKHEYLLRRMQLPKNLVLLFKDDIPELVEDDFRNQMYLKLIAHQYVENDWVWMPDADFLITSPLCKDDFFSAEKPNWFYCDWREIPEKTWRVGSEKFLNLEIPLLFLDQPQYVLNKKVLTNLSENYDLSKILNEIYLPAEQVIYGFYAYKNFNALYHWVDSSTGIGQGISYKVNQKPPSYCELDENIKFSDLPSAKYHVFWSHWEKAEEKMIDFLIDAQLQSFGEIKSKPDDTQLFRYWKTGQIDAVNFDGLDGIHLDGWFMQKAWCCLQTDHRSTLCLELLTPNPPDSQPPLQMNIAINSHHKKVKLEPGSQILTLDLKKNCENEIILRFEGGFLEPNGNRTLYTKLESFRLASGDN
jgi:hypothetical protein